MVMTFGDTFQIATALSHNISRSHTIQNLATRCMRVDSCYSPIQTLLLSKNFCPPLALWKWWYFNMK